MSTVNHDDTYYSRWLNNELTEEEKKQLNSTAEEKVLQKIIVCVDGWSLPEIDPNHRKGIDAKIKKKEKSGLVPFYKRTWFYAAACILLLMVSVLILRLEDPSEWIKYDCQNGQTKSITLPDQSIVVLYGKSSMEYDAATFGMQRKVKMKGNAMFRVTKKDDFLVGHENGNIKVLGTIFAVQSHQTLSTIKCIEGKVQVEYKNQKTILQTGRGVRYHAMGNMHSFAFNPSLIDMTLREIVFENAPLEEVCHSLCINYDITFKSNKIDFNRNYSGKFTLTNLDTALRMVFEPMQIEFTLKGKTVYLENK